MGLISKLRTVIRPNPANNKDSAAETSPAEESKTAPVTNSAFVTADNDKPEAEMPSTDAQSGVQQIEALTLSWSKGALIAVFVK